MVQTALELAIAPALVAVATLVARRWGPRVGGLVSAFPAIVGPFLLIITLEHGRAFAARAANGVLLGIVALSGFALAYGLISRQGNWRLSLAAGWACAALAAAGIGVCVRGAGSPVGLMVALASLAVARLGLSSRGHDRSSAGSNRSEEEPSVGTIPVRIVLTALLVTLLSAAAAALGPLAGGVLAALPVLASVLAVFTHREAGGAAAVALLKGMLAGMIAFVAFCQVLVLLIASHGITFAFSAAILTALSVQTAIVCWPHRARPA